MNLCPLAISLFTVLAGLGEARAGSTSATQLAEGAWRGEIQQAGKVVPFNFEIHRSGRKIEAFYINGPERMPVEQARYDGRGKLQLDFPSYSSGLTATVSGERMSGEIFLNRRAQVHHLPFTAEHGPTWRFFPEPSNDYASVDGRWDAVIVLPAPNDKETAIALFTQTGPFVTGTLLSEFGDYRFLSGEMRGRELYLSTFDGGGTQLWRGSIQPDGSLQGSFDSVTYSGSTWTAQRNPSAHLQDPTTLTQLRPGIRRVAFNFPDLDGHAVSSSDPRFAGKVMMIVIAGSWCPTCHDEASFMAPLYEAERSRGLEIVYLMFEYTDKFADSAQQLRAFRDRYRIKAPMLFAGSSARDSRGSLLPELKDIVAFPTTIVLDRKGEVRKIYTAFPGPATGEAHENYKREMRAFLNLLLNETA